MKKVLYFVCVVCLFIGCTRQTQPWAEQNLLLGHEKYTEVVKKLADYTYQGALNDANRVITSDIGSEERSKALINMSDTYHNVSYLEIQAGRASEMLRNTYQWVHSQRGILNILWEDLQEANKRVKDKNEDKAPIPDSTDSEPQDVKQQPDPVVNVQNEAPFVDPYDPGAVEIIDGDDPG